MVVGHRVSAGNQTWSSGRAAISPALVLLTCAGGSRHQQSPGGIRSSGVGVIGLFVSSPVSAESSLGSLQKQCVLLSSKPFLQQLLMC